MCNHLENVQRHAIEQSKTEKDRCRFKASGESDECIERGKTETIEKKEIEKRKKRKKRQKQETKRYVMPGRGR
ncbi:hypothetical protein ALC56_10410 [Trachymyrmex septentrionalis]|uniref:Uncharacterized protein n=1 Tax=Trachymyrmex septentrionalis TaxID=34720 RepID=A0A195F3S8_9HYME|nr:hypothetical protein ALC56_10410 [Trachymyrmex septentrionalis]